MKDFEDYFEKWLKSKNDPKYSRKQLDKISKVLLLLLKQFSQKELDKNFLKELKTAKDAVK